MVFVHPFSDRKSIIISTILLRNFHAWAMHDHMQTVLDAMSSLARIFFVIGTATL